MTTWDSTMVVNGWTVNMWLAKSKGEFLDHPHARVSQRLTSPI